jgi:hypothetical protein
MNRERQRYNPVSGQQEDLPGDSGEVGEVIPPAVPAIRRNRQYSRIATGDEEDSTEQDVSVRSETDHEATTTADDDDDDSKKITITILDFAQSRFQVQADPSWTMARFKNTGAKIHKVAANRQRLIFRGKMLAEDTKTLDDYGLTQDGVIIHLFPKPRVVITDSSVATTPVEKTEGEDDDEEEGGGAGAAVPTIVMDAAQAASRSQILVLGSPEFIEAQNNVKLFSFMLLIISTIELLNLSAIAMGVPQDGDASSDGIPVQTDDYHVAPQRNDDIFMPTNQSDGDESIIVQEEWGPYQYVDTIVSLLGVYVALLGLRASTENTLRLARVYLISLFGTGTLWILFNFFFTASMERKVERKKEEMESDDYFHPNIYHQAFQVMVLPTMVWVICCMRAWQFQHMLHEAETEAEDRIHTQRFQYADEDTGGNRDEELALGSRNSVLT